MSKAPMIAGTMQTDPRSGGVKRSSGVTVLPIVDEGRYHSQIVGRTNGWQTHVQRLFEWKVPLLRYLCSL